MFDKSGLVPRLVDLVNDHANATFGKRSID